MPKLDKDTFLKVCPDIARKYFSDALQEAARQGLYVKWATQSFSLWVPLENGKDGSIQAYLKKVSDDKKRQEMRQRLFDVGLLDGGEFTVKLDLIDSEAIEIARKALQVVWEIAADLSSAQATLEDGQSASA